MSLRWKRDHHQLCAETFLGRGIARRTIDDPGNDFNEIRGTISIPHATVPFVLTPNDEP